MTNKLNRFQVSIPEEKEMQFSPPKTINQQSFKFVTSHQYEFFNKEFPRLAHHCTTRSKNILKQLESCKVNQNEIKYATIRWMVTI